MDHEYKFLDVCVGWPGSVHDARVLGNSKIYAKCESGSFLPNWPKTICNSTVPLVMLGDPAYIPPENMANEAFLGHWVDAEAAEVQLPVEPYSCCRRVCFWPTKGKVEVADEEE